MSLPYYAVIMAGGGGTRLWPLSRLSRPKQLLPLLRGRSLFRVAVDRLRPLFDAEHTLVVCHAGLASALRREAPRLPRANFLIEPEPRNTAPSIALALAEIERRGGPAAMACLTADHYIQDAHRFREVLAAAYDAAAAGHLVTLGIEPTEAVTGFGYIERGEAAGEFGGMTAFRVAAFKEKPDRETAMCFVADRRHSWNSGMFVWTTERIREEFSRQVPALADASRRLATLLGRRGSRPAITRLWKKLPRQSIDYAVMEGARDVLVLPAPGLGWADVGTWDSLLDIYAREPRLRGRAHSPQVALHSSGVEILTNGVEGKLIATVGLKDVIIVDTGDALLVCARGASQEVRDLVARLATIRGTRGHR
jgi:mannose-1-phosphate guanylyltransferase